MAQPYVGEIRMFAGAYAPAGWSFCDGGLLAIAENEVLFQLIGTTYGGDGVETFALPDLRGRVPVHRGSGYTMAERGGVETVTLTAGQVPQHGHAWQASAAVGTTADPNGALLAAVPSAAVTAYAATPSAASPAPYPMALVGAAGGSQPHENMHPFVALSFIISLYGIFPSPT